MYFITNLNWLSKYFLFSLFSFPVYLNELLSLSYSALLSYSFDGVLHLFVVYLFVDWLCGTRVPESQYTKNSKQGELEAFYSWPFLTLLLWTIHTCSFAWIPFYGSWGGSVKQATTKGAKWNLCIAELFITFHPGLIHTFIFLTLTSHFGGIHTCLLICFMFMRWPCKNKAGIYDVCYLNLPPLAHSHMLFIHIFFLLFLFYGKWDNLL